MITININNPFHAAAFKFAAGHFLSDLGGLSGKELYIYLQLDEDDATEEELEKRSRIIIVKSIEKGAPPMEDPYLYVFDLIETLAQGVLNFREENPCTAE